jgi:hypothetical protein
MKQLRITNRKELKNKMAVVLRYDIGMLSVEMRDILLDDLITALENRLAVLNEVQSNVLYVADVGVRVGNETL